MPHSPELDRYRPALTSKTTGLPQSLFRWSDVACGGRAGLAVAVVRVSGTAVWRNSDAITPRFRLGIRTARGTMLRLETFRGSVFENYPMRILIQSLFVLLVTGGALHADLVVLYDDTQGNLPATQPWLFYADDAILSGGTVSQTANASGVNLVTDNAVSAGYSNYIPLINTLKNPSFPLLDRSTGFRLSFELQITSETHVSNDRAGFSVILLANDMQGIEIGFWENEIWAQNDDPLFSHGEGVAFDTTLGETSYDLTIVGNQYFLSAGGSLLLSSSLRDYTAFGGPPYTLGNYLFLGDNTGSAGANIQLGLVTISPIPEPAMFGLLALLVIVASGFARFGRRSSSSFCPASVE